MIGLKLNLNTTYEELKEIREKLQNDLNEEYEKNLAKQMNFYIKHDSHCWESDFLRAQHYFPWPTENGKELQEKLKIIDSLLEQKTKAIDKYLETYGEAGINMMDKLFKKEEPKIEVSKIKELLKKRICRKFTN